MEQNVDFPVGGGLQDFRPGQSSSSSSHVPARVSEALDEPGKGFFSHFSPNKKSAKLGSHSGSELLPESSPSTPAAHGVSWLDGDDVWIRIDSVQGPYWTLSPKVGFLNGGGGWAVEQEAAGVSVMVLVLSQTIVLQRFVEQILDDKVVDRVQQRFVEQDLEARCVVPVEVRRGSVAPFSVVYTLLTLSHLETSTLFLRAPLLTSIWHMGCECSRAPGVTRHTLHN